MNTKLSLEQKELKQKALERFQKEKEKLAKDLKDIKTVYVVYLNESGSEMDFYFINKDDKGESYLDRIYISKPYYMDETRPDQYGIGEWVDLPFNDKPSSWNKARNKIGAGYCFSAGGGGYSKSDHCLKSLYYWLGYTNEDIYKNHKMPRIERLN